MSHHSRRAILVPRSAPGKSSPLLQLSPPAPEHRRERCQSFDVKLTRRVSPVAPDWRRASRPTANLPQEGGHVAALDQLC